MIQPSLNPLRRARIRLGSAGLLLAAPLFAASSPPPAVAWYDPADWYEDRPAIIDDWNAYDYANGWSAFTWYPEWEYDEDDEHDTRQVTDAPPGLTARGNSSSRDEGRESAPNSEATLSARPSPLDYEFDTDTGTWRVDYETYRQTQPFYPSRAAYVITDEPLGDDTAARQSDPPSDRSQDEERTLPAVARSRLDTTPIADGGQEMSGPERTFHGTLEAFRHTELEDREGREETYSLARIRLDSGRRIVMSLGEKAQLDALGLTRGDTVAIVGRTGQVGDRKVIVARRVSAGGRSVEVNGRVARALEREGREDTASQARQQTSPDRSQAQEASNATPPHGAPPMSIVGTLAATERASIPGEQDPQLFLRVERDSGAPVTVHLGSVESAAALDLETDSRIRVSGSRETIDGQAVLRAERIRVQDEQRELNTSARF
jgi:hypothetical protein